MNVLKSLLRLILWVIGLLFLGMLALIIVFHVIPYNSGHDLVLERLLFGFVPFLKGNFDAISWNARTWAPGLGAFLVALIFIHRSAVRWAQRTGRHWGFLSSFCIVMVVPVLFVISFLVPGVLLQWEVLRETVWIDVR